jgi:hypothetical protein
MLMTPKEIMERASLIEQASKAAAQGRKRSRSTLRTRTRRTLRNRKH